uniref:Putative mitogen-activated protein (MAP) kinase kinase kinase 10 n=1 Tax=Helianthus annuus TaxID=4232 RepID=A0A251UWJ6_HELAN
MVAEQQVSSLCLEAHEFMIAGRWLDLALLMITSADLVFSKASNKEKTKASGEKVRNDMELIFTSKFKRYLTKDLPDIVMQVSVMKRLRHPNIVLFMGAVISPNHVCIVTEFLCR